MPLQIVCPSCKTGASSSSRYCTKAGCGFPIGDMPNAERLLRSAQASLDDPARARQFIQEALTFWPGHPKATQLEAELKQREQKLAILVAPVETAVKANQFEAADAALRELERRTPAHPALGHWQGVIRSKLAEASRKVADGQACEKAGRREEAASLYEEALRVCTDCAGARDGLARCPPPPVADLRAAVVGAAVNLTWRRPHGDPRAVTFRVVRKASSVPTGPNDGTALGSTSTEAFTDAACEPGKILYYAVFTERGGVPAAQGVVAPPVMRTAEVADLQTRTGDGVVSLEWQPPASARDVEVWRVQGREPRACGEGTRVACVLNGANDSGLSNGTPYGYRVCVVFDGPDGKPLASPGATCLLTPARPPSPVLDLKVSLAGDHFEARWTAPPGNHPVRVYSLGAPPRHRPGEIVPFDKLAGLGTPLSAVGAAGARGDLSGLTELHLFPVTIAGAVVVAGSVATVRWVPEVTDLVAQAQGDTLTARWKWPQGVTSALVLIRPDAFASGPDDTRATQQLITLDQYNLHGWFQCPMAALDQVHLSVLAAVNRQGRWEYSAGGSPVSQRLVVMRRQRSARYRIAPKRTWWLRRTDEYFLFISPNAPVELPELVLLGKPDGLPLGPTDGTVLLTVPAGSRATPAQPLFLAFKPPWPVSRDNVRLFPVQAEDFDWLELFSAR